MPFQRKRRIFRERHRAVRIVFMPPDEFYNMIISHLFQNCRNYPSFPSLFSAKAGVLARPSQAYLRNIKISFSAFRRRMDLWILCV